MSPPPGIRGCKHPRRDDSKFVQCDPVNPENPSPAADCLVTWSKVWSAWIPDEVAAVAAELRVLTDKKKIEKVEAALTKWAEEQQKSACKLLNRLEELLPPRDLKGKGPGWTDPTQPPPPPFRRSL